MKKNSIQLLSMKIIFWLLIFLFSLQNLALNAQNHSLNLSMKKVSLHEILKEIKNQSGNNIIYNNNLIDKYDNEFIEIKNANLEVALKKALDGKELSFKIVDDIIIIEPKEDKQNSEKSNVLYQNVKGVVFDYDTKMPLIGATVLILDLSPTKGGITDLEGIYKIERVPIGRYNIQINYMGYEPVIIPEVLVKSGKEVIINTWLKQSLTEFNEVIVKAYSRKDLPINSMASISARSFSIEEAERYAGALGDPFRMVSAFAGSVPSSSLDNNAISIRGQAPKNVKYLLEGVEIPNPNHFDGAYVAGGGYVCLISNHLMGNSDFFTGAFPAQYGNATAGIFDLNLRTGNNEKREYTFQASAIGIDVASEGPIVKNGAASYNINYRYSTFGLLENVGVINPNQVPIFQDISFKINIPTKKAGVFSFWGIGGIDYLISPLTKDSSLWDNNPRESTDVNFLTGTLGLSHKYILGNKSFINFSIVASGTNAQATNEWIDDSLKIRPLAFIKNNTSKITYATVINHKFNSRLISRAGINCNTLFSNIDLRSIDLSNNNSDFFDFSTYNNFVKTQNKSYLWQAYLQSKYNLGEHFIINGGINTEFFELNGKYSIDPRFGLNWNFLPKHTFSLGLGKYSQLEEMRFYFIKKEINNQSVLINKNLDFSKALHFVLGYDYRINDNLRLKIEPYFEKLYNIPGKPNSNYSLINFSQDWGFSDSLQNNSSGYNYGFDFTFERFLTNGYYYLLTASIFDSKYKGSDGITRNTLYNNIFATSILFGKEYTLTKKKNNILGVNTKFNIFGGERITPVDMIASTSAKQVIYNESQKYEKQNPIRIYIDFNVQYRINKGKYSSILAIEIINLLSPVSKELNINTYEQYYYHTKKNSINKFTDSQILLPNISYKIEF